MSDHDIPLALATDLTLGGRWTSLSGGGREWLWTNPDAAVVAARKHVQPGDAFVDAGGGEECFPSVREPFDHGVVWSRPWCESGGWQTAQAQGYRLKRQMSTSPEGVLRVDYLASAERQSQAAHATHLLLDLSQAARLRPGAHSAPLFHDPVDADEVEELGGVDGFVHALGQGRRSAVCYTLPLCREATIEDGADRLHLELSEATGDLPLGFIIWRNLWGWPQDNPYRSIGVEPCLGHDVSWPSQLPGGSVNVGPDQDVTWSLTIRASRTDRLGGVEQ